MFGCAADLVRSKDNFGKRADSNYHVCILGYAERQHQKNCSHSADDTAVPTFCNFLVAPAKKMR